MSVLDFFRRGWASAHVYEYRLSAAEARIANLEACIRALQINFAGVATDPFAEPSYPIVKPDGSPRKQRFPDFWSDLEVRRAVIAKHRQMTMPQALNEISQEFGAARTPSKSALCRAWQALDLTRDAA